MFDGIAALGLPPRAADALQLLAGARSERLENLVTTTVTRVVESDAFSEVWATATRAAHRALVGVSTSDGGGLGGPTDDGVGIQLGAVVERVKQNLIDRGLGAAELIPTIDKVIILGAGENLATIRTSYALANAIGLWLPIITLALFGARHPHRTPAQRRPCWAPASDSRSAPARSPSCCRSASPLVGIAAGALGLSPDAPGRHLRAAGRQHDARPPSSSPSSASFIAILGWVMGRSAAARGFRARRRRHERLGTASARARGLNTESFGLWLGRQRILVRTIVAVLAVLWLFALRPLSVGDISCSSSSLGVGVDSRAAAAPSRGARAAAGRGRSRQRRPPSPRSTPTSHRADTVVILAGDAADRTRHARDRDGCRDRSGRGIRSPKGRGA